MKIAVGQGSCGIAAGAMKAYDELKNKLDLSKHELTVTGCIGMCYLEPIVDVYDNGELHRFVKVSEASAEKIAACVNSGDFSNIEHIIVLMDGKQEYKPNEIETGAVDGTTPYFKGSFQEFLTSLQGTLAKDIKSTTTLLDNYSAAATELDTSRDSVSGVDLNDEAVNMMQYQKSYSAACRMMTTLDEALDKLINGTGVAGR